MAEWELAFETMARARGSGLVRYAYLLCGDWQEAEDLVQEALIRTFIRVKGGTTVSNAEAYVRRAVATASIDRFRSRRRWRSVQHLFASSQALPDPGVVVDDRMDVVEALSHLGPRHRTCIVLHYFEDMRVETIATTLGLKVGTTKRYLSDARKALEVLLGPLSDDNLAEENTMDVILEGSRS